MHETSTPLVLPATSEGTLGDLPARLAADRPGRVAFAVRAGSGWTDVTSATFAAEVTALAKGFVATLHPVAVKRIADLQQQGYLYIKP